MKSYYHIIITGVLCLVMGIGLGYGAKKVTMEKEKVTPEEESENASAALLNAEESPLLDNIAAQFDGNIVEINNESLLIKKGENSFEVKTGDFPLEIIKILYDPKEGKKLVGEDLKLEDVKIGDKVSIRCILEEGIWQLETIVIKENFPES